MSRQIIHRTYTEDKRRARLVRVTSQVKWLVVRIRVINRQASVLVITLHGRSKKITANQL